MFELITIQDELLLKPFQLGPSQADKDYYVKERVIQRYHGRFIPKVGLCFKVNRIHILDSDSTSNQVVLPATGEVKLPIELDLLTFRPSPSCLLTARISAHTENLGIHATIGDNLVHLLIPEEYLQAGSIFDKER